jgi:hypothetical protein
MGIDNAMTVQESLSKHAWKRDEWYSEDEDARTESFDARSGKIESAGEKSV